MRLKSRLFSPQYEKKGNLDGKSDQKHRNFRMF